MGRRFLRLFGLLLLLMGLGLQVSTQAVGTTTVTVTSIGDGRVVKYTIAWVSDASGDVTANTAALAVVRIGYIHQVKFVPDAAGTQPSDLYDVTLVDAAGVDLLFAAGANLSNAISTATRVNPGAYWDGVGTLELIVDNAGAAKGGTVMLWVAPTR